MYYYRPDIRFPDKLSGFVRELKAICQQMVNTLYFSYLYKYKFNVYLFIFIVKYYRRIKS